MEPNHIASLDNYKSLKNINHIVLFATNILFLVFWKSTLCYRTHIKYNDQSIRLYTL